MNAPRRPPWYLLLSELFLGFGLWLILTTLAGVVISTLAQHISGLSLAEFDGQGGRAGWHLLQMSAVQLVGFGGAALLAARYSLTASLRGVPVASGLRRLLLLHPPRWQQVALAMGIMLVSLPFVQWISFDATSFELPAALSQWESELERIEARLEGLIQAMLGKHPWGALLSIALLPALMEELFFRGYVQQQLRRRLGWGAVLLLTGLLFSLMHGQPYGFFSRWAMGITLGFVALWSGSLWPAVAAHFANNALNVAAGSLATSGQLSPELLEADLGVPTWLALISLLLTAGGLVAYRQLAPAGVMDSGAPPTPPEAPLTSAPAAEQPSSSSPNAL